MNEKYSIYRIILNFKCIWSEERRTVIVAFMNDVMIRTRRSQMKMDAGWERDETSGLKEPQNSIFHLGKWINLQRDTMETSKNEIFFTVCLTSPICRSSRLAASDRSRPLNIKASCSTDSETLSRPSFRQIGWSRWNDSGATEQQILRKSAKTKFFFFSV